MSLHTILNGLTGIAIVMLVGCGGGDDPPPSSGVDNVTLGGTAAKGIINGGNVVAEELDVSGTVIAQIGNSTTAADGSYTLTVDNNYTGGPIQVTINADADTEMKCDVPLGCGVRTDDIVDTDNNIDFSEWYKPGSLTMVALVAEAASGDTIDVNITPYTNLAASRAMEAGSLTAVEIYNANSEVSNLLGGIDILNTQPLDITDETAISNNDGSTTRVAYAAFSAAIAALANTNGGSPDINAALETLSNSFNGGTIIGDDTDTAMDDSTISLQEILDGARSALAETDNADTSGAFIALETSINEAPDNNVDPQPSENASDTALAKVKTFVSEVRTWGTVVEEELRLEGETFSTEVDLASTAADASIELVIGPAFEHTINAIFRRLTDTDATDLSADAYVLGQPEDPQFESGTITYVDGVVTIINGVIDGVTVDISVQLPVDGSTVDEALTASINSATFMSTFSDLTISSGTVTATLATPYSVDYSAIKMGTAADPDISGGSVDLTVALTQKGESLESPVTFVGSLATTLVNPIKDDTTGEIIWLTPSTLTLAGNVSDTIGNSFDASLTANISNAETFEPVGDLNSGPDFVQEDENNWLDATIGLDFRLKLAGLPEASVNISGERIDFEEGTATITIRYDGRQIVIDSTITGSLSNDSVAITGSVAITNQNGVTMYIVGADFDASSGTIEYNGQPYGTITELNNGMTKITYIDDTFETL